MFIYLCNNSYKSSTLSEYCASKVAKSPYRIDLINSNGCIVLHVLTCHTQSNVYLIFISCFVTNSIRFTTNVWNLKTYCYIEVFTLVLLNSNLPSFAVFQEPFQSLFYALFSISMNLTTYGLNIINLLTLPQNGLNISSIPHPTNFLIFRRYHVFILMKSSLFHNEVFKATVKLYSLL